MYTSHACGAGRDQDRSQRGYQDAYYRSAGDPGSKECAARAAPSSPWPYLQ